jgi:hypothetical protein
MSHAEAGTSITSASGLGKDNFNFTTTVTCHAPTNRKKCGKKILPHYTDRFSSWWIVDTVDMRALEYRAVEH